MQLTLEHVYWVLTIKRYAIAVLKSPSSAKRCMIPILKYNKFGMSFFFEVLIMFGHGTINLRDVWYQGNLYI